MKNLILFLSIFIFASASAQYDFMFRKKELAEIRRYENSIKSEALGFVKTRVAKDYFAGALDNHDYFPLSFKRTNDSFYPQLVTSYFYKETDSTLVAATYDWNIMDYVKNMKTDGEKFETEKSVKRNTSKSIVRSGRL